MFEIFGSEDDWWFWWFFDSEFDLFDSADFGSNMDSGLDITGSYDYDRRLLAEATTAQPQYLMVNCFTGFGKASLEGVQKFLATTANL